MIPIALGIARHLLTAAGGALVNSGYLSGSDLETAVGAAMTLLGIYASIYAKRSA